MTMTKFYALLSKDGTRCIRVAPSTSPDEAYRFLTVGYSHQPGEIYECRMSDGAAVAVRDTVLDGRFEVANRMLKLYAHSLTKVGDVT